jgi:ribosomal protein S18 acetylase RimI-like enzyme
MEIRKLTEQDQPLLLDLLKSAGSDWAVYYQPEFWPKYCQALTASLTYIVIENNNCIAYIRCRDDTGFGIYIYDLLVSPVARGRQLGKTLMSYIREQYPHSDIYVMSDVDVYYTKMGYKKIGSIFQIN